MKQEGGALLLRRLHFLRFLARAFGKYRTISDSILRAYIQATGATEAISTK